MIVTRCLLGIRESERLGPVLASRCCGRNRSGSGAAGLEKTTVGLETNVATVDCPANECRHVARCLSTVDGTRALAANPATAPVSHQADKTPRITSRKARYSTEPQFVS